MTGSERQDEKRGPRKHPFVDCEHIILPDNRVVECQIEGEGELGAKAHQISANVADLRASRVRTAEDEDERATATDCHAQCLLPRDRFLENEEGEYHGKDRHRCGDNAGIDRRGDAQPDVVQSLVKHDAEQSRLRQLHNVAHGNMLARTYQRGHPKEQSSPHHTKRHHRDAVKTTVHRRLADRSHQPPDGLCGKHTQMCLQGHTVILHLLFIIPFYY